MVDPFYQKTQSATNSEQLTTNSTQWKPVAPQTQQVQLTPAQIQMQQQQVALQIQQINQQQLLLQQQYAQLNTLLQNPQTPPAQKQQVQQQMKQLTLQYNQNVQTLQTLGWGSHVNKPTQVKTSGSKISAKWFLIWCAALFLFVVGGLVGVFYYLIQNPRQLASVGLDITTTKTLLQAFTAVFFGLLLFAGIALLIVNIYRLVTVKNKSKLWHILWSFLWFILLILSIILWSQVLTMVRNISITSSVDSTKLVIPYISFKSGPVSVLADPTAKIIAPAPILFTLNTTYFNNQILPTLGQVTITSIRLNCWNRQNLPMDLNTSQFAGNCVYMKKGSYPLKLNLTYTNALTQETLSKILSGGSLNVDAEILIVPSKWTLEYNSGSSSVTAGTVPAKVSFDANSVFSTFNLPDYSIIWDVNGDGVTDKQNTATFTYVYKEAKLYDVNVRFPGLNNYLYTFPVRIEQSDVPVCEVLSDFIAWTDYSLSINFLYGNALITEYEFSILDQKNKWAVLETVKNTDGILTYKFPGAGLYAAKVVFMTDEGKQGECESEDIQVGAADFDVLYNLFYKSPDSPEFKKAGTESWITFVDDVLTIKEIPTIVQVQILAISPTSPTATKKVLLDSKPILSSDGKTFEMKIDTSVEHKVSIVVEDTARWATTEKVLTIKTKKDDIVGKLTVRPDTIGTDPFTVTFDASTTVINDSTDEIVYFTRDFGDGTGNIKKNVSQSIMTHVYRYDNANENGEYTPVLTIKTKKGREITISPENKIIVKKATATLKIHLDSHPAQLAMVGDRVNMSLELNGVPTTIQRDFGNGKTLECQGRQCVSTTTTYDQPGDYIIRAKVIYENQPLVEGNISIKVQ